MGPNYNQDTDYDFSYTCGLALNSSAVLFVGVKKTSNSNDDCIRDDVDILCRPVPKLTVLYDFEKYAWIEQDSLGFPQNENDFYSYGENRACTIEHSKNQSRFLDFSSLICVKNYFSLNIFRIIVISNIFYSYYPQNTDAAIVYLPSNYNEKKYSRNLVWYSDPYEIKWYSLDVKNSVPGEHGN